MIYRSLDLDEAPQQVKGGAATIFGMWITNTATTTRWVKFFNALSANVVVGTTTPLVTIGIPGNTSDDISGNFGPGNRGLEFDTGLTIAAVTGVLDSSAGAPGANDIIINVFYV